MSRTPRRIELTCAFMPCLLPVGDGPRMAAILGAARGRRFSIPDRWNTRLATAAGRRRGRGVGAPRAPRQDAPEIDFVSAVGQACDRRTAQRSSLMRIRL